MKKYMFVVPSFASGGAERAVANLSSELAAQGEDVTVVIYFKMPDEYYVDSRVKVINLSGGNMEKYDSLSYLKKIRMLRHIMKEQNPDFILPFLPQVTIHTTLAGFDMHNRIIHTVRNNPALEPENKVKRNLCNLIVKRSWKTIVQNEKQRSFFSEKYRNKLFILFNPVSEELLNTTPVDNLDIKTVIGVGRLGNQKNFPLLINAFNNVAKKLPGIQLKIFGEGEEHEKLQNLICSLKAEDKITLMGRNGNMKSVYESASLFVLSSNYEGMPNTLIEAMAVGLPCISTDCETGPSDLIDNEISGLLIPVGDQTALENAIYKVLENPETAKNFGENAKKKIREVCSVSSIVNSLKQICER